MRISYTTEQEDLRGELRAYFAALMTPDRREALTSSSGEYGAASVYRETIKQMGRDGWLTLGWPTEHGGHARSTLDQLIFTDEAAASGAPVPFLTINTVAPTIMAFGTDEQKRFYLPKIAAGELHFSIGYSEPAAGTDLASLRTSAVRDGDDYVVNGQKMWTSLIEYADYVWLAVRTNTDVAKHRGISVLIVPTNTDGFAGLRCTPWPGLTPAPPTTPTCGCRPPTWSGRRTADGNWSPTSSTTNASRWSRHRRSPWH